MKTSLRNRIIVGGAITALAAASSYADIITWDDGEAADDNWSSGANWSGTPDNTSPVNGDSVVLTPTAQSRLDYAWTIESGQSLTSTGSGNTDEMNLADGTGALTLATGGTMDMGFLRPRFGGGAFTIEAGASLDTDVYGLDSNVANITFEASAAGVTTWNNSGAFQIGLDNLVVDLSNYDNVNGTTLTLVNYGGALSETFASVTLLNGTGTIDYGSGSNDSIVLNGVVGMIPEPTTLALFGAGVALLAAARRRTARSASL